MKKKINSMQPAFLILHTENPGLRLKIKNPELSEVNQSKFYWNKYIINSLREAAASN